MKASLFTTSIFMVGFASSGFAGIQRDFFFVVQNTTSHECTVTATDQLASNDLVVVGSSYGTKAEARRRMRKMAACRTPLAQRALELLGRLKAKGK